MNFHDQVKVPILAMKGGNDLQTYVDILVPNNANLTLIKVEYIEKLINEINTVERCYKYTRVLISDLNS